MKRSVRVKATDTYGVTVDVVGKIDTGKDGLLTRDEVDVLARDLEQRLTALLPELRKTSFKVKLVVE